MIKQWENKFFLVLNMSILGKFVSILVVILLIYVLVKPPVNTLYNALTTPPDLGPNTLTPVYELKFRQYTGNIYRIEPESESSTPTYNDVVSRQNHSPITIKNSRMIEIISELEDDNDEIIVWIHGGFFLSGSASPQYKFYTLLANKMGKPIYIFDYPEHFKYNQKFALDYIFNLMGIFSGKKIYLMGDSAGSFYCALFLIHNFGINDKVFDYKKIDLEVINTTMLFSFFNKFNSTILNYLFKLYFLRKGLFNVKIPDISVLPGQINLISSEQDFLLSNTKSIAMYNLTANTYYYDCDVCAHDFQFMYQNSEETLDLVDRIYSMVYGIES